MVMTTDLNIYAPSPGVYMVSCSYCHADSGEKCHTESGKERDPHVVRWQRCTRMRRTREMWFVLREDDPRFGLEAGDILRCVNYPWDAKVSVLFREWDGYVPECNQYTHSVSFLGFVPYDMEAA